MLKQAGLDSWEEFVEMIGSVDHANNAVDNAKMICDFVRDPAGRPYPFELSFFHGELKGFYAFDAARKVYVALLEYFGLKFVESVRGYELEDEAFTVWYVWFDNISVPSGYTVGTLLEGVDTNI